MRAISNEVFKIIPPGAHAGYMRCNGTVFNKYSEVAHTQAQTRNGRIRLRDQKSLRQLPILEYAESTGRDDFLPWMRSIPTKSLEPILSVECTYTARVREA